MVDFILGFLLIWVLVALAFGLSYMVWDVMKDDLREFLINSQTRRRVGIFLKITAIVSLVIIFAIKILIGR